MRGPPKNPTVCYFMLCPAGCTLEGAEREIFSSVELPILRQEEENMPKVVTSPSHKCDGFSNHACD